MASDPEQTSADRFEIFLTVQPGLEPVLAEEARAAGFDVIGEEAGGVTLRGGWPDVWRANLVLRGAGRVLARFASFRAMHLAQLDKRARKLPWADILSADVPVRVDATCRASRIYHHKAAAERVARAIREELGAEVKADADLRVMVRIEDDLCTLSIETSGAPLHQRGHKQAVSKAPMRETLAALFLRQCGFDGVEPVLDPMCGSGTFVIEAAEIAAGLAPGRSREFGFQKLASFDPSAWDKMKADLSAKETPFKGIGSDRDQGAVQKATANAERAGVADLTSFLTRPVSDCTPPDGPPGLVMINPPYGARIGNRKLLFGLYSALGQTLKTNFKGWRVGLVTSDGGLAKATGLPFEAPGPVVDHGGVKIRLYRCAPL